MNNFYKTRIFHFGEENAMPDTTTLARLKPGFSAVILELTAAEPLRRQLQEAGFTAGTKVSCLLRSPLQDPTAYLVRGGAIALRREDADTIILSEPYKEGTHE